MVRILKRKIMVKCRHEGRLLGERLQSEIFSIIGTILSTKEHGPGGLVETVACHLSSEVI